MRSSQRGWQIGCSDRGQKYSILTFLSPFSHSTDSENFYLILKDAQRKLKNMYQQKHHQKQHSNKQIIVHNNKMEDEDEADSGQNMNNSASDDSYYDDGSTNHAKSQSSPFSGGKKKNGSQQSSKLADNPTGNRTHLKYRINNSNKLIDSSLDKLHGRFNIFFI
jgi:hypothetical protein